MLTHYETILNWNPPDNRLDAEGWELYWSRILDSIPASSELSELLGLPPSQHVPHLFTPDDFRSLRGSIYDEAHKSVIRILRSLNYRLVHVPGCGLSYLPHYYAYEGFDVIASDISVLALKTNELYPPSPHAWGVWLPGEPRSEGINVYVISDIDPYDTVATKPKNDSLIFRQYDCFEPLSFCEPDAIVVSYLLDLYGSGERNELLNTFYQVLRPGGILVIQTPSLVPSLASVVQTMPDLRDEIMGHGFFIFGQDGSDWLGDRAVGQDITWPEWSVVQKRFEEHDMDKLAKGKRTAILLPG